ncbi:hypothetical protein F5Y01DRAFT_278323 [Xylaria sp. FL0043]|nr:hypothetical protein F5Y01DRAFT_278323 [Xylaria sp. FL0043]
MSFNAESAAGLGDFVVADISALVARRLREEHLCQFNRTRDDLLRLERNDDSETSRLLRHQSLRNLEKTWASVLQTLRSELPRTLDELFNELQPEFRIEKDPPSRTRDVTPLSPSSASIETPKPFSRANAPTPSREADAFMPGSPILDSGARARSVTFAPAVFAPAKTEEPTSAIETEAPVIDMIDSAEKSSEKRPLAAEEPETILPKKRAKRTPQTNFKTPGPWKPIKKNMFLCEVEEQECIFSYPGHTGFYVLRCNLLKCRKGLGQDEGTVFTSHPFKDGLALEHFAEEWHMMDSEAEIFRKFAIRVIDAERERNVDKSANTQTSDINASVEDQSSRPPSSPRLKAKDKKPERPYSLFVPRASAAEASTSASASKTNETFKESFYRAGPLLSTPLNDEDADIPFLEKRRQPDVE